MGQKNLKCNLLSCRDDKIDQLHEGFNKRAHIVDVGVGHRVACQLDPWFTSSRSLTPFPHFVLSV